MRPGDADLWMMLIAEDGRARAPAGSARVEHRGDARLQLPRRHDATRLGHPVRHDAVIAWIGTGAERRVVGVCRRGHHGSCSAGGEATGSCELVEHRRVVGADVANRKRVEHGEHHSHTGRPSKSPISETRARSPTGADANTARLVS